MKNKLLPGIILAIAFLVISFVVIKTPMFADDDSVYEYINVTGTARDRIHVEFLYSDDMLLTDARTFSTDLAKASVCLAGAGYDKNKINPMVYQMGYEIDGFYQYDNKWTIDDNDHVAWTMAHKDVENTDKRINLVVIRGTTGNEEWFSNFNLGSNNGGYHSGFYSAAYEVIVKINEQLDNDKDNILWVTGHSRGAAVANIIAGYYTAKDSPGPGKVFGYTFACPNVSKYADTSYTNIYNFNNSGDMIAAIPFDDSDWGEGNLGYHRFGQDISWNYAIDIQEMGTAFLDATGEDYSGADDTLAYESVLKTLVKKESQYYDSKVHFGIMLLAYAMMEDENSSTSLTDVLWKYGKDVAGEFLFNKMISADNILSVIDTFSSTYNDLQEAEQLVRKLLADTKDYSEEEFAAYLSDHQYELQRISRLTGKTINSYSEGESVLGFVLEYGPAAYDLGTILGSIKYLFDNHTGTVLRAIPCAHMDETYVITVSHYYYGYKAYAGVDADLISIPDNITSIGPYCFEDSTVSNIVFPINLKAVGNYAFYACSSLTGIDLPGSLNSIGYAAFAYCSGISRVSLTNSLFSLGELAFSDCVSIKELTVPIDYQMADCFERCSGIETIHYLKGSSGRMVNRFDSESYYPNSYFCSGEYCSREVLKSIDFEEGVVHIGDYAFYECIALENISFPSTLETIGDYAFYGTDNLRELVFPEGIEAFGISSFRLSGITSLIVPETVISIPAYCFEGCSSLAAVDLPDSLIDIRSYAFSGCTSLTKLELSRNLESLWMYAFKGCTSLTEISLPIECSGVTCFKDCNSIETIHYLKGSTGKMPDRERLNDTNNPYNYYNSGEYCSRDVLRNVDFEEGITYIGKYAFYGVNGIESIKLPSTLESISEGLFYECKNLAEIEIPDNVESIGLFAFYKCENLIKIEIPRNVKSIENMAFSCCNNLSTIVVDPENQVFDSRDNCNAVITVNKNKTVLLFGCKNTIIPSDIDTIGYSAFYGNTSITQMVIPEGVTVIGQSAFNRCENLATITFPKTLQTIGDLAFYDCVRLTDVYYSGTQEEWEAISISDNTYNGNMCLLNAVIHFNYTPPECVEHNLVKIEAVQATYESDGNIEYWICSKCGKCYIDAAGTKEITLSDTIIPKLEYIDISKADVDFVSVVTKTSGTFWTSYDGVEKKPGIKVIYEGDELSEGTNYIVSYFDNINVGIATVTVTGQGGYIGSVSKYFLITFKDVPLTHNFQKAVYWAVDEGIAAGYTGTKLGLFGVGDNITRGQVAMFLWRAAGQPAPKGKTQTFTDVPTSSNFYKAIQWAYEQGITGGYTGDRAGQFGPSDNCTRGQIVMFLWRYAGKPLPEKNTQTFSDVPTKHNFYKAVQWASEQGITAGYSDGSFGVNKTCTRGHCVTFLYRLLAE